MTQGDAVCLTIICLSTSVVIAAMFIFSQDLAREIRLAIIERRRRRQLARLRVWFPAVYERREWRARL